MGCTPPLRKKNITNRIKRRATWMRTTKETYTAILRRSPHCARRRAAGPCCPRASTTQAAVATIQWGPFGSSVPTAIQLLQSLRTPSKSLRKVEEKGAKEIKKNTQRMMMRTHHKHLDF